MCVCECGTQKVVRSDRLVGRGSKTRSCGCLKKEWAVKNGQTVIIDITGIRFGFLVATRMSKKRNNEGRVVWECICDCGGKKEVSGSNLRRNVTRSCGCRGIAAGYLINSGLSVDDILIETVWAYNVLHNINNYLAER